MNRRWIWILKIIGDMEGCDASDWWADNWLETASKHYVWANLLLKKFSLGLAYVRFYIKDSESDANNKRELLVGEYKTTRNLVIIRYQAITEDWLLLRLCLCVYVCVCSASLHHCMANPLQLLQSIPVISHEPNWLHNISSLFDPYWGLSPLTVLSITHSTVSSLKHSLIALILQHR